jgi:hypothetical protein
MKARNGKKQLSVWLPVQLKSDYELLIGLKGGDVANDISKYMESLIAKNRTILDSIKKLREDIDLDKDDEI